MSELESSHITTIGSFFAAIPLGTFLHGIYTCILTITLWAIAFNKERQTKARKAMVLIIVFLYISTTVYIAIDWSFTQYIFVENVDPIQAATNGSIDARWRMYHWTSGLTSGLNTIIADAIMIWRCWVVWGSHYQVIVLPALLLASQSGTILDHLILLLIKSSAVFGWLALHINVYDSGDSSVTQEVTWITVYLSLSLGTTLFCTILIIYRVIRVGRYPGNDGTGLGVYRGVIEILIESALLYAISLILWMAFLLGRYTESNYPEMIYVSITGIAPTLIVGRVASGQARPNDSWKSSSGSTIRFGGPSIPQSESVPSADGALRRHEAKLEDDESERSDSRDGDGAFGSSRRASVGV
ncbi:hypothetical protein EDD18DRAFT_1406405 [Armillaria luteobubalina]|uniref:Uncharacterized protein n=1 Tax=Armillaria luteobubalina TaxID=153913 RepID=A0AA39Q179_9AGAR|nr:hypothetical protein EDD18DRAFT_1406405 [Armillaria luteobubalina]